MCRVHRWFYFYNFCGFTRCCASLPRWEAGIASYPWTVADLMLQARLDNLQKIIDNPEVYF